MNTVEDPISKQPREAEKVSATGAGCLWECVNTDVYELEFKWGFCQGGRK